MDHLHVLAQKDSLVEIAAESLAVQHVPQVLLVHGRIAVRESQSAVELPVQRHENDQVSAKAQPHRERDPIVVPTSLLAQAQSARRTASPRRDAKGYPRGNRCGSRKCNRRGNGNSNGASSVSVHKPQILVNETYTFPDSLGAMGFDLRDAGFHILLDKNVPDMIGAKIKALVDDFLGRHGLTQQDIKGWILHPGGARLLGNVEIALGLNKSDTQPSWDILANVGNLSSATILFILQEWLDKRPLNPGDIALAAAFGPGFSAEFLLLQWT